MHKVLTGRLQAISKISGAKSMIVPSALSPRLQPLHTSTSLASTPTPKHTPDTYSKEVDTTPIDKTVNRLDPDSDSVQRPDEPPSGPWSRAGAMTEEYTQVESGEVRKQPYTPSSGSKGRYGVKGKGPDAKSANP